VLLVRNVNVGTVNYFVLVAAMKRREQPFAQDGVITSTSGYCDWHRMSKVSSRKEKRSGACAPLFAVPGPK
jgi:hypothetical protein